MKFRRILPALLLCSAVAHGLQSNAQKPPATDFLPTTFAGWQGDTPEISSSAAKADPTSAAVLQEYGFVAMESISYARDNNTLKVRALQFADATGAYGAYTFYRRVGMKPISVGKQGAYDGTHLVFWS